MEKLAAFMLATVSEKTGYPASMLELSMDMEADLGIDSIKRVEILGAMMDAYPDLPEINPDELADLRTLQQVVDRLEQSAGHAPAPSPAAAPAPSAEPDQEARGEAAVPGLEELSGFMLATVSEKTGYPASMLELSMDMEADLGIDSIKRVEILGAMMDAYPDLPEINPDELADLRTLQQVVDRLGAALQPPEVKPVQARLEFGTDDSDPAGKTGSRPESGPSKKKMPVRQSGVRVKPLPPADRLYGEFPPGHVCVVTSEGTGLTAEVVYLLKRERMSPVVLLPPWAGKTGLSDVPTLLLQDTRDASIAYALERVATDHGPIAGFFHLSPGPEDLAREGLELAFMSARHIKARMSTAAGAGPVFAVFLWPRPGWTVLWAWPGTIIRPSTAACSGWSRPWTWNGRECFAGPWTWSLPWLRKRLQRALCARFSIPTPGFGKPGIPPRAVSPWFPRLLPNPCRTWAKSKRTTNRFFW